MFCIQEAQLPQTAREADDVDYKFNEVTVRLTKKALPNTIQVHPVLRQMIYRSTPAAAITLAHSVARVVSTYEPSSLGAEGGPVCNHMSPNFDS